MKGVHMQLTINIPDFTPLTLNSDIQELKKTIKLSSALMFYKNGKLSIEQASKFADMSIYDLMIECSKNDIPVISYKDKELINEMQMMKNL